MMSPRHNRSASWQAYLETFHERRPGITEEILSASTTKTTGRNPYAWLLEALPQDTMVLDIACGSAPLGRRGQSQRTFGIDRSEAELEKASAQGHLQLLRGDACALPFRDQSFDAAVCSMGLMLFDPVDTALAEIRRVLRSSATAVFLLPGSSPLSIRDRLRYLRLLSSLHVVSPAYPNHVHFGRLHSHLERAGFLVVADERLRFRYFLRDKHAVRRFVESLYLPNDRSDRIEAAVAIATDWTGSEIGIPLRRVECTVRQTTR